MANNRNAVPKNMVVRTQDHQGLVDMMSSCISALCDTNFLINHDLAKHYRDDVQAVADHLSKACLLARKLVRAYEHGKTVSELEKEDADAHTGPKCGETQE